MKSAVETLSPTRAKLTVEVPFEELKPSLDAAYKKIAQQINVPGFRRGKVPPMVIDRQVGRGAVLDEAINEALPKLYVEALQANELEPLAQPEIEITRLEDNETLEFSAEVTVRPPSGLPGSVADFEPWDVVVLSDVRRAAIRDNTMTALSEWVEQRGGGLLVAGGESVFGEGGYRKSPIERLTPVTFERRDEPEVALVLVLVFSPLMYAYFQSELNKVWEKTGAASAQ